MFSPFARFALAHDSMRDIRLPHSAKSPWLREKSVLLGNIKISHNGLIDMNASAIIEV
jgi:hypothetical protein